MITIREMLFEDLDQVLSIEEANFSVPWTANGFLSFLMREDAYFLVAVEGNHILGYCGVILTPPESDITNICVAQDFRRKGVARKLLEQLSSKLVQQGIREIHLEVRESNLPALTLYRKLGFNQDGLRPRYYESPTENAVLMTCRLPAQ
ncbi:ribosomal protein S18-alanine N-acetyltransferase [Novisyntrophococcus fermenticellae]|uniref:ribosomal protein S18-alanine N-acetyltransferase n=1 Tax=Novisyntrophococcus fermenticellae TaxID=2068655 RepID=UPI001E33CEFD|nr:ribosomal protein S18-alanine N-acetyltransferase [Novisyntrophococcus fermenticellae]